MPWGADGAAARSAGLGPLRAAWRAVLALVWALNAGAQGNATAPMALHDFAAPSAGVGVGVGVGAAAAAASAAPATPWALALLPDQKVPATRYTVERQDGEAVLRVDATASYGNLLHPLPGGGPPGRLAWRWRLDEANPLADLRRREADDSNLRVCALFDLPLDRVPFVERQLLRVARARAATPLPAATVCYVWDARLPAGTAVDNPYARRVRSLVLRSSPATPTGVWVDETRDLAADFLRLFGDEAGGQVPPLVGVAVGADADNTRGHSAGRVAQLRWR